jgi:hypothetical protein
MHDRRLKIKSKAKAFIVFFFINLSFIFYLFIRFDFIPFFYIIWKKNTILHDLEEKQKIILIKHYSSFFFFFNNVSK